MEQFLDSLKSPSWWFGVVIAGILVNLFSAYLKNIIDKMLNFSSVKWRKRTDIKLKERNELIDTLRSDFNQLMLFALTENRYRVRSMTFYMQAFFSYSMSIFILDFHSMVIYFIVGIAMSFVFYVLGIIDHLNAVSVCRAVVESSGSKVLY